MSLPAAELCPGIEVTADPARSLIPLTLGTRRKESDEVDWLCCEIYMNAVIHIEFTIE